MIRHVTFNIDPMKIPVVANRMALVDHYVDRWFEEMSESETLDDWCERAELDTGDRTIALDVRREIRRRKRCQ